MKLDPDLIKKILIAYEELPYGGGEEIEFEGYTENQVNAHQELLMDGGYIKATKEVWINDKVVISPESITLDGHELLKKLRNDTVFKKVLSFLKPLGPIALKAGFEALLKSLQ